MGEGEVMKIFKAGLITVLALVIFKAFEVFESAGEMDSNANPIAFGFIIGFFVLLIILTIFSGSKKNDEKKPMATPAKGYPGYRKCRSKYR